jgi:hypothetical protein
MLLMVVGMLAVVDESRFGLYHRWGWHYWGWRLRWRCVFSSLGFDVRGDTLALDVVVAVAALLLLGLDTVPLLSLGYARFIGVGAVSTLRLQA